MASYPSPAPEYSPCPFETDDNAKTMKELAIPWDDLKKDSKKILQLVDFSLSLLEGKEIAVLQFNKITFLYNAIYAMLHVLFMPRELFPGGMDNVLDRIIHHRIARSTQWMVFDKREVSLLSLLLRCGRWTYIRLIDFTPNESLRSEGFFDTFAYYEPISHRPSHWHPTWPFQPGSLSVGAACLTSSRAIQQHSTRASNHLQLKQYPARPRIDKSKEMENLQAGWNRALLYIKELRQLHFRELSKKNRQLQEHIRTVRESHHRIQDLGLVLALKDRQLEDKNREIDKTNKMIDDQASELQDLDSKISKIALEYGAMSAHHHEKCSTALAASTIEEMKRMGDKYLGLTQSAVNRVEELTDKHVLESAIIDQAMKRINRLELELAAKNKEMTKPHDFRDRQQERHAREIEEKEAEAHKAISELKVARKELSRHKQTQKQVHDLEATVADLKTQLEAKELALGMASGNHMDAEARASASEAKITDLESELATLRLEKENFDAEKTRLLAFRTNPEAEKDRTQKAVREAITSKAIEIIEKESLIKSLKDEIRRLKSEIRRQNAELEAYERGRIVDQNMLRELSGDTYRLKNDLKDAELYHVSLEDRVFNLEQKLAETEISADSLRSELQMLRVNHKLNLL